MSIGVGRGLDSKGWYFLRIFKCPRTWYASYRCESHYNWWCFTWYHNFKCGIRVSDEENNMQIDISLLFLKDNAYIAYLLYLMILLPSLLQTCGHFRLMYSKLFCDLRWLRDSAEPFESYTSEISAIPGENGGDWSFKHSKPSPVGLRQRTGSSRTFYLFG